MLPGPGHTVELPYLIPIIVCEVFSAEVVLKCLIFIERGQIPRTHELEKLYKGLSPESKTIIQRHFAASVGKNPTYSEIQKAFPGELSLDLMDVLKVVNRAFEEWRYTYEIKPGSVYGIEEIISAVHNRIVELRPDLSSVRVK